MTDKNAAEISLLNRTDLPEHLRILADEFPRDRWPELSEMGQLTQFWLERHLMFRKILGMLDEDAKGFLDKAMDPAQYAPRLHRLASMFVGQLHEHHNIEDHHYFPMLTRLDTRMEAAFDLLETDHTELDANLKLFTDQTNAALTGFQHGNTDLTATGTLHETMQHFQGFLNRHLLDEEDIIVPVLLKHGEEKLYG